MAQATRDNQNTDSAGPPGALDASVGELIDQLAPDGSGSDGSLDLTPVPQVGEPLGDGQAEPNPGDAGSEEDLLRSVQALLREVPGNSASNPGDPPSAPEPASSDAPADLELPEDLLACKPPQPDPKPPPPDPGTSAELESLDQELAGLADQLISDEISAEPEPPPRADDGPTLAAAVAASVAAPHPSARPAPEQVVRHQAEPPRRDNRSESPRAPQTPPIPEPGRKRLKVLERATRPLLLACDAASAPLRHKPQHVRDRIGWHALWLAFLGICVWAYVLFIRSPEAPTPTLLPARQAVVEHAPAKSKSAGKDSHTPDKKPAPKKQASAGGH